MAKGLHFISTKVHPSTRLVGLGSTKHAPIVELVIFLSREPTPDLERWIRNKTATLFEISDQIFVRCTIITLGREQNPANLSGRLRNLLIEELPKTLSIFNKKRMRRFCIFADEITTHVVKDMMIYHHGELWQQIACLIFEHTQQGTENEVITKAFSDVARLENNGRLFDRLFVDDSQIPQSVTWVVKVPRSRRDDYKAVLSAAFDKFRHASKHLIDDASSSDIVDRAQPALPPQATDCQVQNYALFRKSHKSAAATESGTDEIIEHAFTENDSKAQHKHSVNINGRRNSRREDYLSGERWSDPKQGVEEHATVQVDEMGTILDDIDKRLHTMSQMDKVNMHRSLHGTKLLVSQSSLQLLSGNWMAAKTALNQQLQDIREAQRTYTPDPDRLRAVGEDASYWLAEILIRIGEYTKAAELLDMVTPKWNLGQANPRHQHHNRTEVIRSVHLLRLQALCGANLELGSNIVDEQLQRAQASLGYFHNSDASSFKQFDNEPLDYQVAQLLTDFTISKILSVRGNYKEALKLMMTTTAQAIRMLGEDHIWTLEASVFTSKLMVLTSRIGQGRVLAERCLETIQQSSSSIHPLALEASSVLVSVAESEGRLLEGLESASEIIQVIRGSSQLLGSLPLMIDCRTQLGLLHLHSGAFKASEELFSSILQDARSAWGPTHPTVLRARTHLALAQYRLGKLKTARDNVLSALKQQLQKRKRPRKGGFQEDDSTAQQVLSQLIQIGDQVYPATAMSGHPILNTEDVIHPDILNSILTLIKIEIGRNAIDEKIAIKSLNLVVEASSTQLERSNSLAMDAAIELGRFEILRATKNIDPKKITDCFRRADGHFRRVFKLPSPSMPPIGHFESTEGQQRINTTTTTPDSEPVLLLDEYNPFVLKARQESIIANLYLNHETDIDVDFVVSNKEELLRIALAQECRLGWDHPDCLKSLTALLPVQLMCNDIRGVEDTMHAIRSRLDDNEIRSQRTWDWLRMEERVVQILLSGSNGLSDRTENMLRSLIDNAQREAEREKDQELSELFQKLCSRCQDAQRASRRKDECKGHDT